MWIETHCHLDYLKAFSLSEILEKSALANVSDIITISVTPSNITPVYQLACEHKNVYCSQGVHPHEAKDYNQDVKALIKSNVLVDSQKPQKTIVAIGEIGLDYHYNNSPIDEQKAAFSDQLQLASTLDLPVIIHSREAEDDTIEILEQFPKSVLKKRGVIHSFTSSKKLADYAVANGFKLGINGIITFKSAKELQETISTVGLEHLIVETDAPFLTPVPHRGKENGPYFIPHVGDKLAELFSTSIQEVAKITTQNAKELFCLNQL